MSRKKEHMLDNTKADNLTKKARTKKNPIIDKSKTKEVISSAYMCLMGNLTKRRSIKRK